MPLDARGLKSLIEVLRDVCVVPEIEDTDEGKLISYYTHDVAALFLKQDKMVFQGLSITVGDHVIAISDKLELALLGENDTVLTIDPGKLEAIANAYVQAKLLSLQGFSA